MRTFIFILLSISYISCNKTPNAKNNLNKVEVQKISINKESQVSLSSFVDQIEYKILPDHLNVGFVNKMLHYKDFIILCDYEHLYVIHILDKDLNLLTTISQYGEGPGEYNSIMDVTVNSDLETIDILSFYKVLRFDFGGNFIEEFKPPFAFTKFQHHKDKSYIVYVPSALNESFIDKEKEGFILFEWNARDQTVIKILPDGFFGRIPFFFERRNLTKWDEKYFFTMNFADTVYVLDSNKILIKKYFLDFDGKNIPFELIDKTDKFLKERLSSEIMEKYIFQDTNLMVDKHKIVTGYRGTNQASGFLIFDQLSHEVVSGFLLDNDIDMGRPFLVPKLIKDNVLYTVHDPQHFINHYEQNKEKFEGIDNGFTRLVKKLDYQSPVVVTKYYLK